MMHKTCSINYGHLADLQKKTLPTTDLNKKNFHLIKYLLATFIFSFLFNLYLSFVTSGRMRSYELESWERLHICCSIYSVQAHREAIPHRKETGKLSSPGPQDSNPGVSKTHSPTGWMPTHTELSGIKLKRDNLSTVISFSPLDAIVSIWSHRDCWPHICRCCKRGDYVLTFILPRINTTALGWFISPVIYHPHKLRISNICSSLSPPANPYSIMIYT